MKRLTFLILAVLLVTMPCAAADKIVIIKSGGPDQSNIAITGGTIDGTVIGGVTPKAISGTTGTFSGSISATGVVSGADYGNSIVLFGASMVEAGEDGNDTGFFRWANYLLDARFGPIYYEGVGGENTGEMYARMSTVLAHDTEYVLVAAGGISNGMFDGDSVATMQSEMTTIFEELLAAGKKVIAGTVLPSSAWDTATEREHYFEMNLWLRTYATNHDIILVDMGKYVINYDDTDPSMETINTTDGTHLSSRGGYLCGKAVYEALQYIVPTNDWLPISVADTTILSSNPMMVGTAGDVTNANASGDLATSWTGEQTTGGTAVYSKVARTDGLPGVWQRLVITAPAGATDSESQIKEIFDISAYIGDSIHLVCEMNMTGTWTNLRGVYFYGVYFDESWGLVGGIYGTNHAIDGSLGDLLVPIESGVFKSQSGVVPALSKYLMLYIGFATDDSGGGTVDIGRCGVVLE